jgi:hypothetical protein
MKARVTHFLTSPPTPSGLRPDALALSSTRKQDPSRMSAQSADTSYAGSVRTTLAAAICVILFSGGVAAQPTAVERQRLVAHLEMTSAWLVDEVSGLTPRQLAFKPSADQWSIAQVIDHLLVVGPIYWDALQTALKSPPSEQPSAFSDADILWYGIDRGAREKALSTEVPAGRFRDLPSALAEYRKNHARLVEFVNNTSADLRAHIVLRQGCDAYQWALLITTHEQRHILQIREIKADKGFPRR